MVKIIVVAVATLGILATVVVWPFVVGSVKSGSDLTSIQPGGISGIRDYVYYQDWTKCVGEGSLSAGSFDLWMNANRTHFSTKSATKENGQRIQRYSSFQSPSKAAGQSSFYESRNGTYCSNLDASGGGTEILYDRQTSKVFFFTSGH